MVPFAGPGAAVDDGSDRTAPGAAADLPDRSLAHATVEESLDLGVRADPEIRNPLGLAQVIGGDGEARPLPLEAVAPSLVAARPDRAGLQDARRGQLNSSRRFSSATDPSPWVSPRCPERPARFIPSPSPCCRPRA